MRADSGGVETYDNIMLVSQLALNIPLTDAQAVVREMEHTESFMPLTGRWLRRLGYWHCALGSVLYYGPVS